MSYSRERIDRVSVERAITNNKQIIGYWRDNLQKIDEDPDRKERLERSLCGVCFYTDARSIGPAWMTERPCAGCETIITSGGGTPDILCPECAKKSKLCRKCGSDIDLINRRKRHFPGDNS